MEKKRILLVEDDQLMQKLYADLLSAEKYSVESVSDGKTALEKLRKGNWDLVLLDFVLPDMNGLEILKSVNIGSDKPVKKIVFLTNLDSGPDLDRIKKTGLEHLTKSSLDPAQFITKIKSYL